MPLLIFLVLLFVLLLGGNADAAEAVAQTTVTPVATLQDSLVTIIQQVTSGVQAGVSFLQAEIPDVIRQLLLWKAAEAGVWIGIQVLCVVIGLYGIYHGVKSILNLSKVDAEKEVAYEIWQKASYRDDTEGAKREAYKQAKIAMDQAVPMAVVKVVFGIAGAIAFLLSIGNVFGNVLTLTQILVAPKVYLIQYAAELIK